MQLIYLRGGNVANSNFDPSLLTPVDENQSSFEANLTPVDENQEDPGAYLDKMPPPEGFFKKLPKNILIGLAKLGHSTLNMPHDLSEVVGEYTPLKISQYIPKQDEYDFEGMVKDYFGQKGGSTMMDKLIQGGIEYLPEMIGGRGLLRAVGSRLKGTHQLAEVERLAKESGPNFGYRPETINEARNYLPNTTPTREMLTASIEGDYPASYAVQSQLGRHISNLSKSPLASERLLAPQVSELRNNMKEQLISALKSQGMHKEADMLTQGINNYRQYMQVKNAIMPVVKKLGIPITSAAAIGFGYNKIKNMLKD